GTNMNTCDLSNADLRGAKLQGAAFSGANLKGAKLSLDKLADADFGAATWIDGTECDVNSTGKCVPLPPKPATSAATGGAHRSPDWPNVLAEADAMLLASLLPACMGLRRGIRRRGSVGGGARLVHAIRDAAEPDRCLPRVRARGRRLRGGIVQKGGLP